MRKVKPDFTSTPHGYGVFKRRGIHDSDISLQSQITDSGEDDENSDQNSSNDYSEHEQEPESFTSSYSQNSPRGSPRPGHSPNKKRSPVVNAKRLDKSEKSFNTSKQSTPFITQICLGVCLVLATIIYLLFSGQNTIKNVSGCDLSIKKLGEQFPNQNHLFWTNIEANINEIVSFEKPSVIIFLYDKNNITSLLRNISYYAQSRLNHCENDAIFMNSKDLNKQEYIKDYGKVIQDLKPRIEQANVIVIENLDDVDATVAQAFHALCDEHTPLVPKSLYLFTIKGSPNVKLSEYVYKHLKNKWSTIENDKIEPLLTRIVNVVLQI